MDVKEFREFGKAAVDYIAQYYETIDTRQVLPSVQPDYLRPLLPKDIPQEPDTWPEVIKDMDRVIMPGMTHWRSPHFHAYFPSGGSFPSMVGEMMCAALGVIGFSWMSNPACTELELVMMDWLARAFGLPEHFLNRPDQPGIGILQSTASESTMFALLLAKERAVRCVQATHPHMSAQEIKAKLVCYSSEHANSSVEKAGLVASVPMRLLPTDKNGVLRGPVLKAAIEEDLKNGLIPCYVCATFGTTGHCAFDCVEEIGPICERLGIWLHIDAAYAGAALICPEMRHLMKGMEYADSLVINLHKWLLINFDCAAMWFKNKKEVEDCYEIERIYLKHQNTNKAPDLMKYQVPLGRKFRSLKVWFTLRLYGVSGLQSYIRRHIRHAEEFEKLVLQHPLYEVVVPKTLGLVCFRLKEGNEMTHLVIDELNRRKNVYVIPGSVKGKVFIRFVVCNAWSKAEHLWWAWTEIQAATKAILQRKIESKAHKEEPLEKKIKAHFEVIFIPNNKRFKSGCEQHGVPLHVEIH